MAKSKNHTNHNQNKKAHRNGITKPKRNMKVPLRYMCPKFVRNLREARKNNISLTAQRRRFEHRQRNRAGHEARVAKVAERRLARVNAKP